MTELKAVQKAALEAAKDKKGFGFFMDMGLGKTLTALTEFQSLIPAGVTRMVVICPNSFKSGWKEEIEKHGIDADFLLYESGSPYNKDFFERKFNRAPIVIVNYEAIRRDSTQDVLINFMAKKPTYIVFDESIQLKTHDAQQTKAAITLSKHAHYRRLLTGKPTTQGPHDLWGQMKALGHLDGRNFYAFRSMFCQMGGYMNKRVVGVQNADILAGMIEPHVFRAGKADWGFDVGKVHTIREYAMTEEQKRQYKSMEQEFVLWLNEEENVTVDAAITKYIKLAQIQAGFIIKEDHSVTELVAPDCNPRINALLDVLNDEVIGKAIVVYVHRHSFNMLSRALSKYYPAWIKGMMDPYEIETQKHRFNNDPNCRIMLVQATAGRYGHTLIGGPEPDNRCATTVFFENSYSLDTRSQLEDRNHRFGQLANAVVYIDLCGTSMDRNVIRALQRKEAIFQTIFSLIKRSVPDVRPVADATGEPAAKARDGQGSGRSSEFAGAESLQIEHAEEALRKRSGET
jgi:SNF2 family DNA or RNA helicase